MTAPNDIFLHIGTHRTGTSSLQLMIDRNATLLRGRGYDLAWPGRDGAPNGRLELKFPRQKQSLPEAVARLDRARSHLQGFMTGQPRLLLSEENVLGGMQTLWKGRLYPDRCMRIEALRDALPPAAFHVLMVVRPYESYFGSWFRLAALEKTVPPFRQVLAPFLNGSAAGWPSVVDDVETLLSPVRLIVVDYRKRGDSRTLLARLLQDVAAEDLIEPQEWLNKSLPDDDLYDLQVRLHSAAGTLPVPDRATLFAPPTSAEKRLFDDRYEADLDQIARMPGISLIR